MLKMYLLFDEKCKGNLLESYIILRSLKELKWKQNTYLNSPV